MNTTFQKNDLPINGNFFFSWEGLEHRCDSISIFTHQWIRNQNAVDFISWDKYASSDPKSLIIFLLFNGSDVSPLSAKINSVSRLQISASKNRPTTNQDAHIFSYQELVAATNNFAEDNFIGQGGFGAVYKGQLSCTGQVIYLWLIADKLLAPHY